MLPMDLTSELRQPRVDSVCTAFARGLTGIAAVVIAAILPACHNEHAIAHPSTSVDYDNGRQPQPRPRPLHLTGPSLTLYEDGLAFFVTPYADAAEGGVELEHDATSPSRGRHSLKLTYSTTASSVGWGGVVITANEGWRTSRPAYDLSRFSKVEFVARADSPNTLVEVGVGVDLEGISRDSGTVEVVASLTDNWQPYSVSIDEMERTDVNGLFKIGFRHRERGPGWGDATVWFDDVRLVR